MENINALELQQEDTSSLHDKNIYNVVELQNQESSSSPSAGANTNWSTQNSAGKAPKGKSFFNRRRLIVGGGILGGGTIITFFILSILSGPFQFIHLAELLRKFHFEAQSIAQDERFAREVRLFATGRAERTRMGFLGNKFADKYEAKIKATGFETSYSDKFGLFDGYVIDKTNPKFKNMSDKQIKTFVKETYGVDLKSPSELKGVSAKLLSNPDALVIDAKSMSVSSKYKLSYAILKEAGYGDISSAIGSRFMCLRAGCSFNPMSKLSTKLSSAIEDWNNRRKADLASTETNSSATNKPKDNQDNKPNVADRNNFDGSLNDTNAQASDVKSGRSGFDTFKSSIAGKFAGGGAALLALICIMQSINKNIDNLKQSQVIAPLIKMGVQTLSVGSQIKSGKNVNLDELSAMSKQLSGTDSSGKTSSWSQSQSIQANLGKPNTGTAPDSTLKSIGANTNPFSFIDGIGSALDPACGEVVQDIIMVFSFALDLTGIGLAIQAVTGVVGAVATGPIINTVSHWLSGSAVDVGAVGADFGNAVDFGTTLAANQQYLMAGGTQLSSAQVAANNQVVDSISQTEFKQQSTFAQIFNLYDSSSIISKVADTLSPSYKATFANMFSYIMGSGKNAVVGVAKLFSTKTLAASNTPYNYGFNIVGYSQQDTANPAVSDPYANADYVVSNVLTNQSMIDKAKKCFGVEIKLETDGNWNVLSDASASSLNTYTKEYQGFGCNTPAPADCSADSSDACNWLRLRYFITDTETMNSMSCYQGDGQACMDSGF
jgi:hypothetical protein